MPYRFIIIFKHLLFVLPLSKQRKICIFFRHQDIPRVHSWFWLMCLEKSFHLMVFKVRNYLDTVRLCNLLILSPIFALFSNIANVLEIQVRLQWRYVNCHFSCLYWIVWFLLNTWRCIGWPIHWKIQSNPLDIFGLSDRTVDVSFDFNTTI